ncbi:MAG: L-threonylcarbamoyladenylate synthase [Opitutales bacterium]
MLQACQRADLTRAAHLLRAGHLVALPTETVYGLAADALNPLAVSKVFEVKGRPLLDPLIVHGLHAAMLAEIAHFGATARDLADRFWPGPLTLVLSRRSSVPHLVTAGLDTVAVRAPAHPAFRRVLARSRLCLAAPSANPFGYLSPTRAAHVAASLGPRLSHIVDGGPCTHGLESTILSLANPSQPMILRPGPIGPKALAKVLGEAPPLRRRKPTVGEALEAPGTSERHYSPRTPLTLFDKQPPRPNSTQTATVWLKRPAITETGPTFWLSEPGSFKEAAANCFDLLRRLDADPSITQIRCQVPGSAAQDSLAVALRDRLLRAAAG